ncbi:DUF58 domain-containing protein [Sneathiella limimaris]|uniref:DUF58 domain-containing protein n=1 Tax=Sneathiella limimaris TaxID=1964213 RepID=UPI00146D39A1|nr:DUF58 domain-containing protein [Sneathiella limimaris]
MGFREQFSPANLKLRGEAEKQAAALSSLLLQAHQIIDHVDMGQHGRRKTGKGEDFWQFRPYTQGDSSTEVDWRQTAKRGDLYIRQKELETSESVWFWLDSAVTMPYRSHLADLSKQDYGRLLILALGLLLNRGEEKYNLLGKTNKAGHGTGHFETFAADLFTQASPPLKKALLASKTPKQSQFVLISDFLTPTEELLDALKIAISSGGRGLLLQVVDPAEEKLPFTGRTNFLDMAGNPVITFGKVESIREDYEARFAAHCQSLQDLARQVGWRHLKCRTDDRPSETLARLYGYLREGI